MFITLDFDGLGQFPVDLSGVNESNRNQIRQLLKKNVNSKRKSREVLAEVFELALSLCPDANPSDLWHHLIYRDYLKFKLGTNPSQSWVRTSGEGFEIVIANTYNPLLASHGIRILPLFSKQEKGKILQRLGIQDQVGSEKIDLAIEAVGRGQGLQDGFGIIGGIHAKASLAERVSDDIPASRIMMKAGLLSILCTLDVKSFPPPHGDLVNRGELGTPTSPSDKRAYIESHGDFSLCVSYNSRTTPSPAKTDSGRKIIVTGLGPQIDDSDPLIKYLL